MKLYGIPNCNTVKKARDWLTHNGIEYQFHDFKKQGVTEQMLSGWLSQIDDSKLINRAGMTWRNLDQATKDSIQDQASAIKLMSEKTSVIKRPVLEQDGKIIALGFSEAEYQALFK
ncbi:MAG: ArsC family reductase [Methylophilus sp.]|jgi:Spx/MgsR family transcriptional regulator